VADLQSAVRAAAIVGHAQGFMLLHGGAQEHGWSFDYRAISRTWRGGCIIRSLLLGEIEAAYARRGDLPTILLDDSFRAVLGDCQGGWRRTAVRAAERGLPVPAISSALAFYDGYRCARLPAGLLQAQRDYFGSHTYERVDQPRGETFHTDWAASPGEASPTG
jgi:6-phosphogluconate dehydrogenase